MSEALSTIDQLRITRKRELVKLRGRMGGHFINGLPGSAKESDWLEEDRSFINRGLPLFGRTGDSQYPARLPFKRAYEVYYDSSAIVLSHLDRLNSRHNPEQEVGKSGMERVSVWDIGCGRGVALEDIWAYYGPTLDLNLKGSTLHTPQYYDEYLQRGIEIHQGELGDEGLKGTRPVEGYSLIMAEWSLIYHTRPLDLVKYAAKRLSNDGIFPVTYSDVFRGETIIVDKDHNQINDPTGYVYEQLHRLKWEIRGGIIVVNKKNRPSIGLRYLEQDEIDELPVPYKPRLADNHYNRLIGSSTGSEVKTYFKLTAE